MPRRRPSTRPVTMPILHPHAGGIDVGATEIYVCVPLDCDPQPIRCFGTFTEELHAPADWLTQCGGTSVAMESTGVYWIPLYQILETRGLEVCLVNARHVKNVPGRKTDVQDCQWLQYLHSVGLLRASFRPPETVCAVRALLRHRETLVQLAATHTQHMQKALHQMHLQLHHVLSDLTGVTGLAILDAILAGERDPQALAQHRDGRIKASRETIAKALVGDYRPEHRFTLRQALASYRHYQRLIAECDREVQALRAAVASQVDPARQPLPPAPPARRKPHRKTPSFELRAELYRVLGTDLTQVPGLQTPTVHTLFAELGADLSAFPSGRHFASWLGLCPDNRISGGRGPLREHPPREAPRRAGPAARRPEPVSQPGGPRGLLSPHAGEARRPEGDHRHRAQARADRLPPAHNPAALRREPPRGGRSRPSASQRIPPPRAGPGARVPVSACPRAGTF